MNIVVAMGVNSLLLTWPTIYFAINVIGNQLSLLHVDSGRTITFYNYLISFGYSYNAKFVVKNFDTQFAY